MYFAGEVGAGCAALGAEYWGDRCWSVSGTDGRCRADVLGGAGLRMRDTAYLSGVERWFAGRAATSPNAGEAPADVGAPDPHRALATGCQRLLPLVGMDQRVRVFDQSAGTSLFCGFTPAMSAAGALPTRAQTIQRGPVAADERPIANPY